MRKSSLILFSFLFIFLFFSCSSSDFGNLDTNSYFLVEKEADLTKAELWQCYLPLDSAVALKDVKYKQEGNSKSSSGSYYFYFEPIKEGEIKVDFKRSNLSSINTFDKEKELTLEVKKLNNKLEIEQII